MRFALLPEAEQRATWPATAGSFRALSSVQLRARHWIIRDGRGDVTDEVRGEAVVGEYPILTPGAPGVVAYMALRGTSLLACMAQHCVKHLIIPEVRHLTPWACLMPCNDQTKQMGIWCAGYLCNWRKCRVLHRGQACS